MTYPTPTQPDPSDTPARRARSGDPSSSPSQARRLADGRSFGGSLGWTILGTLIPGLGLWHARRRVAGGLVLAVWAAVLGTLGWAALSGRSSLTGLALNPAVLNGLAVALVVLGLGWVVVIGWTHLALRPVHPTTGQRAAGALLVTGLALGVATPMAVGAEYSRTTAEFVTNVFGDEPAPAELPGQPKADPWANKDRLNVLVIGGDSGTNRDTSLGLRADAVMMASIDTHTGATTLFSLPRQTARIPFPKDSPLSKYFPRGFYDGSNGANAEYFLNAMYNNVPRQIPKGLLGSKVKNVGAEVMKLGVGEALGLKADYYVVINMDGFKEFINALGGVTLNVNYRIPIGGKSSEGVPPKDWIEVGPNQRMNGRLALWYARGRYGLDDYSRMERQRCVINAVVEQAKPEVVLTRFEGIAAAGSKIIMTDIPRQVLPDLLDLALKVKGTKLHSVVFSPDLSWWVSADPDWDKVRTRVRQALKETAKAEAEPTAPPTASASPTASGSKTPGKTPTSKAPTKTDDLSDACAYHPQDYVKK